MVVKLCDYIQVQMDVRFIIIFIPLLVSQDPGNYDDAPTEGIRRVLEIVTGQKIPRTSVLETDKIGIRHPCS